MAKLAHALAAAAGNAGGFEITFVGFTRVNGGTNTVNFPTGTQAGDVAVVIGISNNGTAPYPSGWLGGARYNGVFEGQVSAKVLTASDVSTGYVQFTDSTRSDTTTAPWKAGLVVVVRPTAAASISWRSAFAQNYAVSNTLAASTSEYSVDIAALGSYNTSSIGSIGGSWDYNVGYDAPSRMNSTFAYLVNTSQAPSKLVTMNASSGTAQYDTTVLGRLDIVEA